MRLGYTWNLKSNKILNVLAYVEDGLQSLKKEILRSMTENILENISIWKLMNWKKKKKLFKKARQIMKELVEELGISESINWRMSFIQNLRRKNSQVRKIDFIWNYGKEHQLAFKYFFLNARKKTHPGF